MATIDINRVANRVAACGRTASDVCTGNMVSFWMAPHHVEYEYHVRNVRADDATSSDIARQIYQNVQGCPLSDARQLLEALIAQGVRRADIIDKHIPTVARRLGQNWENSDLSFANVTIACGHLQTLLAEADRDIRNLSEIDPPRATLLLIIRAREHHTLGGFVTASRLRRAGLAVRVLLHESDTRIHQELQMTPYDVVVFSSSRPQDIDAISDLAVSSRTQHDALFALSGLVLDLHPNLRLREPPPGLDIVTNDLDDLRACCDRWCRADDQLRRVSA
ncbi:MAG: hypothetical protein OXC68_04615 [Aestuariivita sp.]|nr:hypothetical protein [Aestuariivita sp.]